MYVLEVSMYVRTYAMYVYINVCTVLFCTVLYVCMHLSIKQLSYALFLLEHRRFHTCRIIYV